MSRDPEEYSVDWVAQVLDYEGLAYGLRNYFDLNDILDPELRRICLEAAAALDTVEEYLRQNVSEDFRDHV